MAYQVHTLYLVYVDGTVDSSPIFIFDTPRSRKTTSKMR